MRISSRSFVLSLMAVACSGALACSSDIGKAKSALSSSDEDKSADVASDAGDAAEKSDDDAGAVTTDETNADKAAEDADSDSDDDADLPASGFRDGIYRIVAGTLNDKDCSEEGPSRLDTMEERYTILVNLGDSAPVVFQDFCHDPKECRTSYQRYAAGDDSDAPTFTAFGKDDSGKLSDDFVYPGSVSCESCTQRCTDGFRQVSTLGIDGNDVELTVRSTVVPGYKPDASGSCDVRDARDLAETLSCDSYAVYRAKFSEKL